jgi:hypothetical protein
MAKALISKSFLIFLLYFILLAYVIGSFKSWFLTVWWFDIPMHFLGGVWLALLFLLYFKKFFVNFDLYKNWRKFFIISGFVVFIGIGWEIFEFLIGAQMTLSDTLGDLFFDFFGGLAVSVLYFRTQKSSS